AEPDRQPARAGRVGHHRAGHLRGRPGRAVARRRRRVAPRGGPDRRLVRGLRPPAHRPECATRRPPGATVGSPVVIVDFLARNPLLTLFVVVGGGFLVGRVRIGGFSLGVAGVLFTGIALGALDARIKLPEIVYLLGLGLFVYTMGL